MRDHADGNTQGLVIVATLLCSSMRGAKLQECKVCMPQQWKFPVDSEKEPRLKRAWTEFMM